jgi:predicted kinase
VNSPLLDQHMGFSQGIYSPESSATIYEHLARLATTGLQSGFSVLIDGACLRRSQRQQLLAVAAKQKCPAAILHVGAETPLLIERIRKRNAKGRDASEADIDVLNYQLENQESLSADERAHSIDVDTSGRVDPFTLREAILNISANNA